MCANPPWLSSQAAAKEAHWFRRTVSDYSLAVLPVTPWRHRVGEILTLCAFGFVWARAVEWFLRPEWGRLWLAPAAGGVALAATAYERGKRLGRRSPEQSADATAEAPVTPPQHLGWYRRKGFAWFAWLTLYFAFLVAAAYADPLWLDVVLCTALTLVVVWWQRRWRRARPDSTATAVEPSSLGPLAVTVVLMGHIVEWVPLQLLVVLPFSFAGFLIWLFAYCWGCHRGRCEAFIASLAVARTNSREQAQLQDR